MARGWWQPVEEQNPQHGHPRLHLRQTTPHLVPGHTSKGEGWEPADTGHPAGWLALSRQYPHGSLSIKTPPEHHSFKTTFCSSWTTSVISLISQLLRLQWRLLLRKDQQNQWQCLYQIWPTVTLSWDWKSLLLTQCFGATAECPAPPWMPNSYPTNYRGGERGRTCSLYSAKDNLWRSQPSAEFLCYGDSSDFREVTFVLRNKTKGWREQHKA